MAPLGNYKLGPKAVALFQPQMADPLNATFKNLNNQGIAPMITSGFRTSASQLALRQGGSGPNPAAKVSLHKEGLAVDINSQDPSFPAIKKAMIGQNLTWGGTFKPKRDLVHFQLPPAGTKADPAMIAACGGS